VNRQPIFRNDGDRRRFLAELRAALDRHGASLFSYCLMTNHFHLLIRVSSIPLGVIMRELLSQYSGYFNTTGGRVGHLFQGRYKAKLCKSGRQLVNTVVYIHLNPVEAHMVSHPEEWPWCSHGDLAARTSPLLDLASLEESTGLSPNELRDIYLDRLAQALSEGAPGDLDEILLCVAIRHGLTPEDLYEGRRGGEFTDARRDFVTSASSRGYSGADAARTLRCSKAAVSLLKSRAKPVNKGSDPFVTD
jgi:REP element-mobilizing transposase RayT